MSREIRRLFRATYGVPYALQAVNGQLWVVANCQAAYGGQLVRVTLNRVKGQS